VRIAPPALLSLSVAACLERVGDPNPMSEDEECARWYRDLDGDGYGDFLVGALDAETSEQRRGAAHLFLGSPR
jgi:hypothetical protein